MIFRSITQRLILLFALIAILPLALFGFLSISQHERDMRVEIESRMTRLADRKSMEIRQYLERRIEAARLLARSEMVKRAFPLLLAAYTQRSKDVARYEALNAYYHHALSAYVDEGGFYDVFLITPQGEIVYTQQHEADFATNLNTGPYQHTALANAFRESSMTLESSVSEFENYAPSSAAAAFVTSPIVIDNRLIGVLAFQISTEQIYRVTTDATGLGVTGETVLAKLDAQGDALVTAPLKSDASSAMRRRIDVMGSNAGLMRNALQGERGVGLGRDYRGHAVIAAWRYVPELRWGMVVKMDVEEAFASSRQQRTILLEVLSGLLLFAAGVAYFFGRRIIDPVKEMSRTAGEIAKGDFARRVEVTGEDEVANLGRAFNRMTENLQALYRSLEDRVTERTRELYASNQQLSEQVGERIHAQSQLQQSNDDLLRYKLFMDTSSNAMGMSLLGGRFFYGNRMLSTLLDVSPDELLQRNYHEFYDEVGLGFLNEKVLPQIMQNGSWRGEIALRDARGGMHDTIHEMFLVNNSAGEPYALANVITDISALKHAEEEIRNLAFYDPLTHLPNRRLLIDRFNLALSMSARSLQYGAVLFLDMDYFKTLNDTLGHDYGDDMLVEVARRLCACVREIDTVARLGGDEFVVLLEELGVSAEDTSQRASQVAEKIRVSLSSPYQIKGHEYHSSPSIGVALYLGNQKSVDELLKYADMSMYQAKESGRNAVRFFDQVMQQTVEVRAMLEADMRSATVKNQFQLYYQVQVDNQRRVLGAEVLIRWIHPVRGMVPPMEFIPIAEETSLILEVGQWVMNAACRQLGLWQANLQRRDLVLAVNVSAKQFRLPDFVERVASSLRKYNVSPDLLKLELTEGVVLSDVTDVVAKMHALKALGVKLSMDDFGTGYSSLSYLKLLPLDQLKIDQSFVRDIVTDSNDALMVQTIIGMAINFNLNVIAEGVETEDQHAFLKLHGCMAYQGYLFSKPVDISSFEDLLDKSAG